MSIVIRPVDNIEIETTAYDRLSSWLTTLILLVGFLVATLFLIWSTSVFEFNNNVTDPITLIEPRDDREDTEDDELDPGVEKFAEVDAPQLSETLEAVSNAVSTIRVTEQSNIGEEAEIGKGDDNRIPSIDPDTPSIEDGIPAYKRWKIAYEVDNLQTYKKQLDFFNIQIGVAEPVGDRVFRISNVSKKPTAVQRTRAEESKSLRFSHTKARIKRWDEQICRSAGVQTAGNLMVQFYDANTKNIIAKVEDDYLKSVGRELKDVRRTNIKLVPSGSSFEFVVESCQYR